MSRIILREACSKGTWQEMVSSAASLQDLVISLFLSNTPWALAIAFACGLLQCYDVQS